jgi:hypothetical protein
MELDNVITKSVLFGNKKIHAKFLEMDDRATIHFFGLKEPNTDNHNVKNDEILSYLVGLSFSSEESVDVVILWLQYVRTMLESMSRRNSVIYSQENQEADYAD